MKRALIFFLFLGGLSMASPTFAMGNLIKLRDSNTVYYLDGNNIRHPFPTASVYQSWYKSFSGITILSSEEIAQYPLGRNVTVRPGVNIVTFRTDPNFYAVEPGGVLRKFKEREVIKKIFGERWFERVVNLPDAFFGDYLMGEEIQGAHQLPDGIVYQLKTDGHYYYKDNDLIWPFKNLDSVLANNLKVSDIVKSDIQFNSRKREINGFNKNVFSIATEPEADTADCENQKLKVAFILVTKNKYTQEQLTKLNIIKDKTAENFKWATRGLAQLDVSFPITILSDDGILLFTDVNSQDKPDDEVINTFYDNHHDVFDFIILYNNFVLNEPVIAKYLTLTNDFLGTGNAQMHNAFNFGSRGKLKGIANMGNLSKYDVESNRELDQSVNYIIHEISHHWSGRAIFFDNNGEISRDLLEKDLSHWNMYLDFISPLGGNGWQDNGDGTYISKITLVSEPNKKPYSDLDLYFMGLLPKPAVSPIKYLAPDEPGAVGNIISGRLKEVTIDQIIEAMGEWRCKIN